MNLQEYISNHYSSKSVRRYTNQIDLFLDYRGELASQSTYSDIVEYIGMLRQRGLHPKSLRNHLFSLKIYFRYLVATGQRQDHPCDKLNLKDQINRSIPVESLYSKSELETTLKEVLGNEEIPRRDKIILSLLVSQALTSSEVTDIKVYQVNLDEGYIEITPSEAPGRRGNKGRILALKPNQILLIHHYLKEDRKRLSKRLKPRFRGDWLLLTDGGMKLYGSYLNRMLTTHEIHLKPLKIRQSVIAHLLKEGKGLRVVQEFAGHRRTGSTEAYRRTGLEELKGSIEKLHPRR